SEVGELDNNRKIHTVIWRNVNKNQPGPNAQAIADKVIVTTGDEFPEVVQFSKMRQALERMHNSSHNYVGGTISDPHFSFHDPFVFLLHSNVDRLWATWQRAPGMAWRLDPDRVYGFEGAVPSITQNLEPWSGGTKLVPWWYPENQQVPKNCKH